MDLWNSRNDLPLLLNKLGLTNAGVEVGVQFGHFSAHIRKHWTGSRLYCVDRWRYDESYVDTSNVSDDEQEQRYQIARANLVKASDGCLAKVKGFEIVRLDSLTAAQRFKEIGTRFDWIYLDADHKYEAVIADLTAWWPLLLPGGVIAGHDYVLDGFHRGGEPFRSFGSKDEIGPEAIEFGVRKAVREFVDTLRTIEVHRSVHVTDEKEDDGWQSWMLIK